MDNEIIPAQGQASLGVVGERIMRLSQDAIDEIRSQWDEKTMEVIRQNSEEYLAMANAVEIKTEADYNQANELFISGATYLKKGEGFITPFVESMHKPWKTATDVRKAFRDPIESAKKIIGDKITAWRMAERRRIEAEQRKADEERKRKEEAERKRLLAQAEKAEASGKVEKAEEKRAQAESVYTPPTVLADTVKKTEVTSKGTVSGSKTWKVTINDEMELVKGVAAGRLPISCLNMDLKRCEAGIRRWAEVAQVKEYRDWGIVVEEWEDLSARPSTKGKGADKA